MSQQLSETQKGLVFNWKGDEWGNNYDEISRVQGTATDTYAVLDRMGSGRRSLSFNGSSDYVTLPTLSAFGTGDFTVVMKVNIKELPALKRLLSGNFYSLELAVNTGGYLRSGQVVVGDNTPSTTQLSLNTDYVIAYKRSYGTTTGTYYVNGVSAGTCTDNSDYYVAQTKLGVDGYGNGFFSGSISLVRIFNYSLSAQQIANYSRPEYPIEWVDRGAPGVSLLGTGDSYNFAGNTLGSWGNYHGGTASVDGTSKLGSTYSMKINTNNTQYGGAIISTAVTITPTRKYKIKFDYNVNHADWRFMIAESSVMPSANAAYPATVIPNSSGASGVYNVDFTAANTTAYTAYIAINNFSAITDLAYIDNVSVVQLGCVLDLNAEGINRQNISTVSPNYWWDATNNITATVSGASIATPSASNLGAMYFNGSTSNIAFTGMNGLTGDITISFWINVISKGNTDYPNIIKANNLILYYYLDLNYLAISRNNITSIASSTPSGITSGWHHVCITSTSSGVCTIVVDNVSKTVTGSSGTAGSNSSLQIGFPAQNINALLSDVYVWNRIFTTDEIKLLYDQGH